MGLRGRVFGWGAAAPGAPPRRRPTAPFISGPSFFFLSLFEMRELSLIFFQYEEDSIGNLLNLT